MRKDDFEQVDAMWRNIESCDEFAASAVRGLCIIGAVLILGIAYLISPRKTRRFWKSPGDYLP